MAVCRMCDPDHICEWAIGAEQRLFVDENRPLEVRIGPLMLVVIDEDIVRDEAVEG